MIRVGYIIGVLEIDDPTYRFLMTRDDPKYPYYWSWTVVGDKLKIFNTKMDADAFIDKNKLYFYEHAVIFLKIFPVSIDLDSIFDAVDLQNYNLQE